MSEFYEIQNDGTAADCFAKDLTLLLNDIKGNSSQNHIRFSSLSGQSNPQRACNSKIVFRSTGPYAHKARDTIRTNCSVFLPEEFNLEFGPSCLHIFENDSNEEWEEEVKKSTESLLISQRNNAKVIEKLYPLLTTLGTQSVSTYSSHITKARDCRYFLEDLECWKGHLDSFHHTPQKARHLAEFGIGLRVKAIDAFTHCCGSRLSDLAESHFEDTCRIMDEVLHSHDLNATVLYDPGDTRKGLIRECENRLREEQELPKIGEGHLHETMLANIVKSIYPDTVREYSPEWLGKQRIDIFVPSLKVGIEYNGKQHYEAVDFYAGEDALKKTKSRDRRKIKKCEKNEVTLIQWPYSDEITEDAVRKRIDMAISK